MLQPKRGVQLEYEEFRGIDEVPLAGMWREESGVKLPPGASPDMMNCQVVDGKLRKRLGYSEFFGPQAAFPSAVVGLFSMQDDEDNTHLIGLHTTGVKFFDFGTDLWTNAVSGPALTGGATQWHSFEVSQAGIVFSQGVDQVMLYNVAANTYAVLNANCPAARYLTRFTDRLVLGYTVEGGNTKPFRIRRSIAGNHADWTGVGSGFTDLSEYPHRIRNLLKNGTQLAVYTEQSIQLGTRTGVSSAPYNIDPVDPGVGLFADRALTTLPGNRQIFLGSGTVNIFDGVYAHEVPNPCAHAMFDEMAPSAIRQFFATKLKESREVLFFVVTNSGASYPDRVWVYNWGRGIWYPWYVPAAKPHVFCEHRQDDTVTIDELVGTIDQQGWEFDSRFLAAAFLALLTGHDDGKVYRWSSEYKSDAGTAIDCLWTSRDFEIDDVEPGSPNTAITLRSLGVTGVDTGACDLSFYFSTNGGGTWDGPWPLSFTNGTPGATIEKQVTRQVTGQKIRWKFTHTSSSQTFQISKFTPVFEKRAPATV